MKKILVIFTILILSFSLIGKSKMTFKDTTLNIGEVESGKVVNAKPEFADCARAAEKHNVPVQRVREAAVRAYSENN